MRTLGSCLDENYFVTCVQAKEILARFISYRTSLSGGGNFWAAGKCYERLVLEFSLGINSSKFQ